MSALEDLLALHDIEDQIDRLAVAGHGQYRAEYFAALLSLRIAVTTARIEAIACRIDREKVVVDMGGA